MKGNESSREICIIGGGIIGLMIGFYLAKSKRCKRIIIIEEGDLAGGASGKAAGFLAKIWHEVKTSSLGILSFDLHVELAKELNGKEEYGYRTIPTISMHIQEGKGMKKEVIENDSKLNWLKYENISDVQQIDDKSETAQIHPKLFSQKIIEECKKMKVEFIQGKAFKAELKKDNNLVIHVQCHPSQNDDTIEIITNKLILATGPWTKKVAKELLNINIPIKDLPGHSIILKTRESIPALAIFASAFDSKGKITQSPEIFTRPDGTVYVAGENTGAPLPPNSSSIQQNQISLNKLFSLCRLLSSNLDVSDKQKVIEFQTNLCYRPINEKGYPILGEIKVNGIPSNTVFVCSGHGPWGISLGPGSGKIMSEIVLDGKSKSANVDYLQL